MKQNKVVMLISFLSIVIFILIISIRCVQIKYNSHYKMQSLLVLNYNNLKNIQF